MTAMLPATRSATQPATTQTRVQYLYRHCLESGTWAKLVRETRGGFEYVTFTCRTPAQKVKDAVTSSTSANKKHVSRSRQLRNKRRRLAWLEKQNQHATSNATAVQPPTCSTADPARPRAQVPTATPPVARRTCAAKRRKLESPADAPETTRAYHHQLSVSQLELSPTIVQFTPPVRSPIHTGAWNSTAAVEVDEFLLENMSSTSSPTPPPTSPPSSPSPTATCSPSGQPTLGSPCTGSRMLTWEPPSPKTCEVLCSKCRIQKSLT